jgi:hypothetical protein
VPGLGTGKKKRPANNMAEGDAPYAELSSTLGLPQREDALGANRRASRITQELYLSPPGRLRGVVFQNFYAASLTIEVRSRTLPGSASEWHTALARTRLMVDPHYADDAQQWHSLDLLAPLLAPLDVLDCAHALRLTYEQPSPSWLDFGLRRLVCFTRAVGAAHELSSNGNPPPTLAKPAADLPSPSTIGAAGGERGALLAQMGCVLAVAARAGEAVRQLAAESEEPSKDRQLWQPEAEAGQWWGPAPLCELEFA